MVARTKPEPNALVIQFERDGEEPETQLVIGDGERVLLFAVSLLVRHRRLHIGDRLTVRAATDDEIDIP
jgi:hypothetical protein